MKYTKEQKEILKKSKADMFLSGSHNKVLIQGDFYIYESKMNEK